MWNFIIANLCRMILSFYQHFLHLIALTYSECIKNDKVKKH